MAITLFLGYTEDNIIDCPANINIGVEAIGRDFVVLKWVDTQGFESNYEYGEEGFVNGQL
ncbi:hypothetical protein [uncultured Aquimarina sp.]|uniref:hypothetical protein n=1 Tax=uncultured Aquimarina sp. TaxID=575652 RepID=UPI00262AD9DC|nr:hypothetical protein [uncultured Aquimarina sp.]